MRHREVSTHPPDQPGPDLSSIRSGVFQMPLAQQPPQILLLAPAPEHDREQPLVRRQVRTAQRPPLPLPSVQRDNGASQASPVARRQDREFLWAQARHEAERQQFVDER